MYPKCADAETFFFTWSSPLEQVEAYVHMYEVWLFSSRGTGEGSHHQEPAWMQIAARQPIPLLGKRRQKIRWQICSPFLLRRERCLQFIVSCIKMDSGFLFESRANFLAMRSKCLQLEWVEGFCLSRLLYLESTPASETAFKQDAACMNEAGVSVCPPDMGSAVIRWATFCAPWGEVIWSQAPLLLTKTFSLGMRCL